MKISLTFVALALTTVANGQAPANTCEYHAFPGGETIPAYSGVLSDVVSLFVESLQFSETPPTAFGTFGVGVNEWDCMATYQDSTKAVTRSPARPIAADGVPSELKGDDIRSTNMILCYGISNLIYGHWVQRSVYKPNFVNNVLEGKWGFNLTTIEAIRMEAAACDLGEACLEQVAANHGHCPDVMGVIVGLTTIDYLDNSGFNSQGRDTPFGPCTGNCQNFSDPIGFYDPRVSLKDIRDKIGINLQQSFGPPNKFKWEPLLESDGQGFFSRQDHVAPHVGFTVDPISMSKADFEAIDNDISHPNYDYQVEAALLLDRLSDTANSPRRKAIIETMDDKVSAAAILQINHIASLSPTYEQNVVMEVGQRMVELEAVLLAWRQKVLYNLIRPTTIVQSQQFTDEYITTYGGPFQGVQQIKATDFQPYIRTMPHAEYPSGSACIFSAWDRQFRNRLIEEYGYGAESTPLFFRYRNAGASSEPGGNQTSIAFLWSNISVAMSESSESRLWGGMHFTASVPAAEAICAPLGDSIFNYLQGLLGPNAGNLGDPARERGRHLKDTESLFNKLMADHEDAYKLAKGEAHQ